MVHVDDVQMGTGDCFQGILPRVAAQRKYNDPDSPFLKSGGAFYGIVFNDVCGHQQQKNIGVVLAISPVRPKTSVETAFSPAAMFL